MSPRSLARRRTSEQADAFAQLRTWAAPLRLRVMRDTEDFPMIPGRHGRIEWTGGPLLALYSDHPRVFAKLLAVVGIKRHQVGDTEIRLLFAPEMLGQIAGLIHAHHKPGLSSVVARQVGLRTAFKAPPRGKVPAQVAGQSRDPVASHESH